MVISTPTLMLTSTYHRMPSSINSKIPVVVMVNVTIINTNIRVRRALQWYPTQVRERTGGTYVGWWHAMLRYTEEIALHSFKATQNARDKDKQGRTSCGEQGAKERIKLHCIRIVSVSHRIASYSCLTIFSHAYYYIRYILKPYLHSCSRGRGRSRGSIYCWRSDAKQYRAQSSW